MSKLNELINKLEELFELDKTDLDFGIYRVVNMRQKEIRTFIREKLPKKVTEILSETNIKELKENLERTKEECIASFGENAFNDDGELNDIFAFTPIGRKYTDALKKYKEKKISSQLETEVYSHLLEFFSRYYQDGDFISQKRSAIKDKYAIPYNGEEVVMYWANKDQYYIKSSENLKDYIFTIQPENIYKFTSNNNEKFSKNEYRIKFRLAGMDAVKDNNKAKRQMVLFKELNGEYNENGMVNIEEDNNSLVIPFYFKEVTKTINEKQHLDNLQNEIIQLVDEKWKKLFLMNDNSYTGKDSRTILKKHLGSYLRKQTSDFFIHKNLEKFLKTELDFYIKNEVMYLDDVINKPENYLTSEIRKIKAIKTIAYKIIDFLAQFENFQKKLWLKKKFIYETNYCITLDKIPQKFYPEIANNQKQIEEWIKLFAINEIKGDLHNISFDDFINGDKDKKMEFLKQNKFLVVDTVFFPQSFKYNLLSHFDNLDEQTNGLLIHSENFQALNLIKTKYYEKIKCIYIDPPYNTNSSPIAYKNNYKDSSWNTFVHNRIKLSHLLLMKNSIFFIAIDDIEYRYLINITDEIFNKRNYITTITTLCNPQGRVSNKVSKTSEFHLIYTKDIEHIDNIQIKKINSKRNAFIPLKRTGTNSRRTQRPLRFYPILFKNGKLSMIEENEYKKIYDREKKEFNDDYLKFLISKYQKLGYKCILPEMSTLNEYLVWQREFNRVKNEIKEYIYKNGNIFTPAFEFEIIKTCWTSNKFANPEYGSELVKEIIGEKKSENTAKSIFTIMQFLRNYNNNYILDYFAGSGTTGHAVIDLNREDNGNRKYILVEMGNYFDTVLKPRIEKVIYSKDWKNGKPLSPETGVSHIFKYFRMESYEDTLNNLSLKNEFADMLGFDIPENVKEDYIIKYMLDIESRESLMDIKKFDDPFGYYIKIFNNQTGKEEIKQVDLIETFNYLLGIEVQEFRIKDGFITIEGKNNVNERILVVWRNVKEKNNKELNEFLLKTMRVNPADTEFSAIYINGDHTLHDPHNKIFNIAEVFNELMFDTEEV